MPTLLYQQLAEPIFEPVDIDTGWFYECPLAPKRPKTPVQQAWYTMPIEAGPAPPPDNSVFPISVTAPAVRYKISGGGPGISFTPEPSPDESYIPYIVPNLLAIRPPRLPISEYQFIARDITQGLDLPAQLWLPTNLLAIRPPRLAISEYQFYARDTVEPVPPPPGVAASTQFVFADGVTGSDSSASSSFVYTG